MQPIPPHPRTVNLPRWVAVVRWLTLGFVLFLAMVILWADRGSLPAPLVALYAFPEGDKVGHFALYGLFSLLGCLSFPTHRANIAGRQFFTASLWVLAIATLEECSQALFATRTPSLADLIPGWLGALIFAWIAQRIASPLLNLPQN